MEETDAEQATGGSTFRDYARVLFRQQDVIVFTMIVIMATVFVGLKLKTKSYEATVKMLITASKLVESPFYKEANQSRNVEQTLTQSEIVKSDPVLARVVLAQNLAHRSLDEEKPYASPLKARLIDFRAKRLAHQLSALTPAEQEEFLTRRAIENLKSSIRVDPIRDSDMFTITVKDYNPAKAAVLANVVSRAYVIFDLEQQLSESRLKYGDKHPKVKYLQESIVSMTLNLDGRYLSDIDAIGPASVKIVAQAFVPLEPTGPAKSLIFIMAVVMSLLAGVVLAFVFEYMDQTIRNPRDIERALDVPYIASVKRKHFFNRVLINFLKKLSGYGVSYRSCCEQLYLLMKDKRVVSLLVSSTMENEDRAAVACNLAKYLSEVLGKKVLLIDADFHTPALHRLFNIGNEKGFAACLEGVSDPELAARHVTDKLSVLTTGKTLVSPILLFDPAKLESFMNSVMPKHDFIILRSSPASKHQDTAVLVRHVDGLLAVVDEGKVRRHVFVNAFGALREKAGNMLGVVMINRTYPIPGFIYERI